MSISLNEQIDRILAHETMRKIAIQKGSNIDADLLPGDRKYLVDILTDYALGQLKANEVASSFVGQEDVLKNLVFSHIDERIKTDCKCLPQDLSFPEPNDQGWRWFVSFLTGVKS
jgi:hypothetical protein